MQRSAEDRGATAVEFMLILPLLVGLIGFGITLGLFVFYSGLLNRGAEIGARAVAVPYEPFATDFGTRYRTPAQITGEARDGTILLNPAAVTVNVSPLNPNEGEPFSVELEYTYDNPLAGFIRVITGGSGGSAVTLRAYAEGVRE